LKEGTFTFPLLKRDPRNRNTQYPLSSREGPRRRIIMEEWNNGMLKELKP